MGLLSDDALQMLSNSRLRSMNEISACRELLYAVHCRLRDYLRHRQGKDFTGWIEPEWLDVLHVERQRVIAESDLAIGGIPISKVAEGRIRSCEWAVCEQHRASIWLAGEYPTYSETPADT